MRKYLLAVLAVMAVPALALAQISGTRHNIPGAASSAPIRAGDTSGGQICVYCHTPHNAEATKVLWNHTASVQSTGWTVAGATTTTVGTPLPTNVNEANSPSGRCMSCHDGTVAVGDVHNFNGTGGSTLNAVMITNATYLLNATGIQKSHPVHMPYKGATGSALTGTTANEYVTSQFGGCVGAAGCPTTATSVALYGTAQNNLTVECGSCHEPHGRGGFTNLLRVTNAGSALCLSCHIK